MKPLLMATHNAHKLREMTRILEPLSFSVIGEQDLKTPLPPVAETGTTFEENALLKARSGCRATGLITVADDSGLCVDALNGAPGVFSARFAGEPTDSRKNNEKLLRLLRDVPAEKRTARFVCAVACVFPDGHEFTVRGECEGSILKKPCGENGFGYDPLFACTAGCFGTMTDCQKDAVSHRGKALERFAAEIQKYGKEETEC